MVGEKVAQLQAKAGTIPQANPSTTVADSSTELHSTGMCDNPELQETQQTTRGSSVPSGDVAGGNAPSRSNVERATANEDASDLPKLDLPTKCEKPANGVEQADVAAGQTPVPVPTSILGEEAGVDHKQPGIALRLSDGLSKPDIGQAASNSQAAGGKEHSSSSDDDGIKNAAPKRLLRCLELE